MAMEIRRSAPGQRLQGAACCSRILQEEPPRSRIWRPSSPAGAGSRGRKECTMDPDWSGQGCGHRGLEATPRTTQHGARVMGGPGGVRRRHGSSTVRVERRLREWIPSHLTEREQRLGRRGGGSGDGRGWCRRRDQGVVQGTGRRWRRRGWRRGVVQGTGRMWQRRRGDGDEGGGVRWGI